MDMLPLYAIVIPEQTRLFPHTGTRSIHRDLFGHRLLHHSLPLLMYNGPVF